MNLLRDILNLLASCLLPLGDSTCLLYDFQGGAHNYNGNNINSESIILELSPERQDMNKLKINKLGLWFVVVHSAIVITIACLDSLNFSRGFGLLAILGMDFPATFIIMFLSTFIDKIYQVPVFILIPTLSIIFGGLQWYVIGWVISKLRVFATRLK